MDVHVRAELATRLEKSLATGTPLRVKVGFDPTRPDLHIGQKVGADAVEHGRTQTLT